MKKVKWKAWIEDHAIIIQANCGDQHTRRRVEIDRWNQYGRQKETFAMLIWGMQLDIEFLYGAEE